VKEDARRAHNDVACEKKVTVKLRVHQLPGNKSKPQLEVRDGVSAEKGVDTRVQEEMMTSPIENAELQ
jgi:hypothetical protein